MLVSGSGTVVEHLPHHPKFKGSNPGTVTGTWKDEMAKKMKKILILGSVEKKWKLPKVKNYNIWHKMVP